MFHVKQMYFCGSKTAILHNTPHYTHRHALLHRACPTPFARSFQKHITSSAHQPTLSMRDKLPLTQTPTTDNRPFKQPHHKARANNSAIHAFERARRTSRSKDTAPLTQTEQIRPSATCYNERRNRRVLLANRMPLNRQAVAACSFYTQKPR